MKLIIKKNMNSFIIDNLKIIDLKIYQNKNFFFSSLAGLIKAF